MISEKETYITSIACGNKNQDRVAIKLFNKSFIIILADGAGGFGDGAKAADFVIKNALDAFESGLLNSSNECCRHLKIIDSLLFANGEIGESTAIIIVGNNDVFFGCSVGDSGAWLFSNENKRIELTEYQIRKPLIGSGQSKPIGFGSFLSEGIILVASDGLFKYTNIENIHNKIKLTVLPNLTNELVNLVKIKNSRLHDDK